MFLSAVLITILLIITFLLYYYYWKVIRMYKCAKNVPGIKGLPFIGSALKFMFPNSIEQRSALLLDIFEKLPEIGTVWLGPELFYFVTNPEYMQILLNSPHAQIKEHKLYRFFGYLVGNALVNAPVNLWKMHRKMLAPAFNQTSLKAFYPAIVHHSQKLNLKINQEIRTNNDADIFTSIVNCTYDIMFETLFELPGRAQETDENYGNLFRTLFELFSRRMYTIVYYLDFIWERTKYFQAGEKSVNKLKQIARDVFAEKLKETDNTHNKSSSSVIGILIEKYKEKQISSSDLEDNIKSFILAGTDTTATSTAFLLVLLALHPEIQEKLHQEIVEVCGKSSAIALEDLSQLEYLQCVIKETLRLFPGAPYVGRDISQDVKLTEKITIPKNSSVILGYLPMQRSERYWKDALKFTPERFLPENVHNQHAYSWLPFSGGPRNCIGIKFGMMAMKIMTILLVREFKFSTLYKSIEDVELTANVVVHPTNGFKLKCEKRY